MSCAVGEEEEDWERGVVGGGFCFAGTSLDEEVGHEEPGDTSNFESLRKIKALL